MEEDYICFRANKRLKTPFPRFKMTFFYFKVKIKHSLTTNKQVPFSQEAKN